MSKLLSHSKSPIFIVGEPRSGTTLMNTLLAAHPNIAIPYSETKFLSYWMKQNPSQSGCHPEDFNTFWVNYINSKSFSYLGIDADAVLARISTANTYNYQTIFTSLMEEYALKMRKPRWGEKTPAHYLYLNVLFEWYPQARIIWMLRDPRAVVASLINTPWARGSIVSYSQRWCKSICLFEQRWVRDERVKLVKYERLVQDPKSEMEQVCQFINEEYTSEMITNRSETSSPIINRTSSDKSFFQATLRAVDQASLEKWRYALSSRQLALIENVARFKMLAHGYQPATTRLNLRYLDLLVHLSIDKVWHTGKRIRKKLTPNSGGDLPA
jgi:hypothetical protein